MSRVGRGFPQSTQLLEAPIGQGTAGTFEVISVTGGGAVFVTVTTGGAALGGQITLTPALVSTAKKGGRGTAALADAAVLGAYSTATPTPQPGQFGISRKFNVGGVAIGAFSRTWDILAPAVTGVSSRPFDLAGGLAGDFSRPFYLAGPLVGRSTRPFDIIDPDQDLIVGLYVPPGYSPSMVGEVGAGDPTTDEPV